MYLNAFGVQVNNNVFADNSWDFRNALARANFNDLQKGIHATTEFLERFFENLLMDAHHALKNWALHIEYPSLAEVQSAEAKNSKGKNCTLGELAVLRALAENLKITQKSLAAAIEKSEWTVKTRMTDLQKKGYLCRVNGKRNKYWELLIDLS